MRLLTLIFILNICTFSYGQSIILQNVNIIDLINDKIIPNQSLEIRGSRIYKIHKGSFKGTRDDQVINLKSKFIIPGLIDSHTHIEHSAYWDNSSPYNPPRKNMVALLKHALFGGITTIREMACDARVMGELSRAAKIGTIESPDIFYPSLFADPRFFADPRADAIALGETPGEVSWVRSIDENTNYAQIVAAAKGNGSTALKLYALLNPTQIKSIVAEAHKQDLKVWAHAYTQFAKPSEIIESGVNSISHAPLLMYEYGTGNRLSTYPDDDKILQNIFEKMRQNKVSFDPTLFIYDMLKGDDRSKIAAAITQKAHEAGVQIIAGTDSISAYQDFDLPHLHSEIEYYVTYCNFSNIEALKTATINAAISLGLEAEIGSIEENKTANLIVLDKNPLDNIKNTRAIHFVMKNGNIYKK